MNTKCKRCDWDLSVYFKDDLCVDCFIAFMDFVVHKAYVTTDVPDEKLSALVYIVFLDNKLVVVWEKNNALMLWDEFIMLRG